MAVLESFIHSERDFYLNEDNNLFAFSLAQALRYYDFIVIIVGRYKDVSQKMILNSKKQTESRPTQNSSIMTEEQIQLMEEGHRLTTLVHLEIESFYLFSKTLLDKVALFLQNYFGQAHGISLISHDKLTKHHKEYQTAKALIYPNGFSESLEFLKEHICDYRDKQITHLQNPRTLKATIFNPSGQTSIVATSLYPNERELDAKKIESKELSELLRVIDIYLQLVTKIIESNRAKTRFGLRE